MKTKLRIFALAGFMALGLLAADDQKDRARVTADTVYFTIPYTFLSPPVRDTLTLDLGLDYIAMRYPHGFANTADGKEKPLGFRNRMIARDPEQLKRIEAKSGFKVGDAVTVMSRSGRGYSAKVVSFSFVGTSPSTIIVGADLKLTEKTNGDPMEGPGVAVRGDIRFAPQPGLKADEPLGAHDPLRGKLLGLCTAEAGRGVIEGEEVVAAPLEAGKPPLYFVSFWKQPEGDFEIDDVVLYSCLYRQAGEQLNRANLPLHFRLLQVQDLDRDGKAEIFAKEGTGAEVCHLYLVPRGEGFVPLKKGLCAGY